MDVLKIFIFKNLENSRNFWTAALILSQKICFSFLFFFFFCWKYFLFEILIKCTIFVLKKDTFLRSKLSVWKNFFKKQNFRKSNVFPKAELSSKILFLNSYPSSADTHIILFLKSISFLYPHRCGSASTDQVKR